MNRPFASGLAFTAPFLLTGFMGLPANVFVLIGVGFALALFVDHYA
jgi:hypothetical protein